MLVLVEDAAESVAFSYVEAGGLPRIGDRWGQRVQWAGVGDVLMRSMPNWSSRGFREDFGTGNHRR
ncbi:hypothetical protein ACFV8Z_34395 [Streptomyces sp. NPDC059837]|uniref:hypothetical protein n=1 Tax=Streptomyces sp. NPDC059837 TaxID=3346968 RepID=UPI003661F6E2